MISLLTAWLCAFAAPVVGQEAAPPRHELPLNQRSPVIVGASSDSFPLAYEGLDGRWTGFSADLLDAIARVMRIPIERVSGPALELHDRFRRGQFDILQTYSQTPAREQYADFSVPFLTLQGTIFVRKKDRSLKTLEDFRGKRFAVISRNSIGEKFVQDQNLGVNIVYVGSSEEGLRLVDNGTCAGTFLSNLTALAVIDHARLKNVEMWGEPNSGYDIRQCFAVQKGDTELLARLNEGLAILNRTGEFQKIYDHWFGRLESPLISRRVALRYAAIIAIVIAVAALASWTHQRVLQRMITRQTTELSAQKALLQALYDNIPMAVCLLQDTPHGYRVLTINRQAEPFVGLTSPEAENKLLQDLPHSSEWLRELADLLSVHRSRKHLAREERRLSSLGKRIIFTLVPMTPAADGSRRLCVLGEDVTERRTLDEEISQSRRLRAIGELVGGIAHEFNNLLTPISLKTGEIQLDWPGDLRLHGELKLISEAAQRASELTRRLLTFGRKNDDRLEQVHLNSIVTASFALLKLTVDRRIVWETQIPADLPPLYFNPTDLNQIILNLVLNARDALTERLANQSDGWTPTIRVEAAFLPLDAVERLEPSIPSRRQILGWQRLTVRDNGAGMTPEVRERIFEPFYTTKDVGKGTGLGLATVWHIVTEVSGRIDVESKPGGGSAFHVFLPMISGEAVPLTAAPARARPAGGSAHILLAEDDDLVASSVASALRRAGYSVTHEANGARAWDHLQTHFGAYELLVLDVNMPGLDGIELAKRIRNSRRYNGRILIISGRLGSDDLRHIAEAQVDCVLNKPFQVEEFLNAVRDCLRLNR